VVFTRQEQKTTPHQQKSSVRKVRGEDRRTVMGWRYNDKKIEKLAEKLEESTKEMRELRKEIRKVIDEAQKKCSHVMHERECIKCGWTL
jgi:hypothetical protein